MTLCGQIRSLLGEDVSAPDVATLLFMRVRVISASASVQNLRQIAQHVREASIPAALRLGQRHQWLD